MNNLNRSNPYQRFENYQEEKTNIWGQQISTSRNKKTYTLPNNINPYTYKTGEKTCKTEKSPQIIHPTFTHHDSLFTEPEDIPTFSYENERNLKHFQGYIKSKQNLLSQYQNSYWEYMKSQNGGGLFYRKTPSARQAQSTPDILTNGNAEYQNNYEQGGSRLNDVTNPDMYYKMKNKEYSKYIDQQRSYWNENFALMESKRLNRKEINVNPFNAQSNVNVLGKSMLVHNTILEPLPNFSYNKYIAGKLKEDKSENNRYLNALSSAGSSLISGK